jgi:lipopolysaccharide export system permease protein
MRTIRRLIHGEVLRAVLFVVLSFLALFAFFDIVDELGSVGRNGYTLGAALAYVGLLLPSHLYDLLPIAVLIGAIYVMARLAADSEYTILRTSGMGPGRALGILLSLGAAFVVLTFLIGDYVAPQTNRGAQLLKARFDGDLTVGQTGAWIKERAGEHSLSVNVGRMSPNGDIGNIRVFEFDQHAHLVSIVRAASGKFGQGAWQLHDVRRTQLATPEAVQQGALPVKTEQLSDWAWPTTLSADMVAAALLSPDRMPVYDLFRYISHLQANGQDAQRYQIEFWRKVFYPLSCLVMVVLSLPFAYLHFRSGGIAGYVFGGVMAGISFFLLNNVFGFAGNLQNWSPWLTAAAPGLIYSVLSLAAFGWLVLRR